VVTCRLSESPDICRSWYEIGAAMVVGYPPKVRVLVLGGGIAGSMAAIAAAQHGARTTLLTPAPGATALYVGAMEVATGHRDLHALAARHPYHPFVRLGLDDLELESVLDEACGRLQGALNRVGLRVVGSWRETGWYADVHGLVRPAQLVPASVRPGELATLQGRRVAVVGVAGLAEYDATATAEALSEAGLQAFAVEVMMELPSEPTLADLMGRPAPPVRERGDAVAYPPGLERLPPGGFELLATSPSPHGWRLHQALLAALEDNRVQLVPGRAEAAEVAGREVRAVQTAALELRADRFVLATGRYLGGGLVKAGAIREPIFDLGVFHEGARVDREWPRWLHHLERQTPDPGFRAGLLTDQQLRPLNWEGEVAFANLHAAGSLLAGYDYGRDHGFGVPLVTGWLAGRWAAVL
jgi:glycerol-3-phosphate dehydrogenase subunit B